VADNRLAVDHLYLNKKQMAMPFDCLSALISAKLL
jgi:hypothetical protein